MMLRPRASLCHAWYLPSISKWSKNPASRIGLGLPGNWAAFHAGRAPACHLVLPPDPSHVLFVMLQRCCGFWPQLGGFSIPASVKQH